MVDKADTLAPFCSGHQKMSLELLGVQSLLCGAKCLVVFFLSQSVVLLATLSNVTQFFEKREMFQIMTAKHTLTLYLGRSSFVNF